MIVMLLGNGFDLNHMLPTKYKNFLQIVDFLTYHYSDELHNLGDVFGHPVLQQQASDIEDIYNSHTEEFDSTELDNDIVSRLITSVKSNIWFRYLLKCYNRDLGWIDFEKEIATVLNVFQRFLSDDSPKFNLLTRLNKSKRDAYILSQFNFFYVKDSNAGGWGGYIATHDYQIENPRGSQYFVINKEKIVNKLHDGLFELASMLRDYLLCFVENALDKLAERASVSGKRSLSSAECILTFNYTNTFEKLYSENPQIVHIHGNINKKIILGVNPDQNDLSGSVDTTFLQFKKYFQRLSLRSDELWQNAISRIADSKRRGDKLIVQVIGHSLDISDADLIQEIFSIADEIIIYHHNEESYIDHLHKLILLYGKDGFEKLRKEKQFYFMPLPLYTWTKTPSVESPKESPDLVNG